MDATQTTLKPFARLTKQIDRVTGLPYIKVEVVWTGVQLDRPNSFGWGLPDTTKGLNLANRLVAAINAGKAATNPIIKTDVNGKTYVAEQINVWGRRMNADLAALGF